IGGFEVLLVFHKFVDHDLPASRSRGPRGCPHSAYQRNPANGSHRRCSLRLMLKRDFAQCTPVRPEKMTLTLVLPKSKSTEEFAAAAGFAHLGERSAKIVDSPRALDLHLRVADTSARETRFSECANRLQSTEAEGGGIPRSRL